MHKSVPQTKFTKSCTNAIEAFHRALDGHMFWHEQKANGGNVACPFITDYTIGLRPCPTTTYSIKTSTNSRINCFLDFCKNEQTKHQNTTMVIQNKEQRRSALTCREWTRVPKWKQKHKIGGLGLPNSWISWALMLLECWGRFWGEWNFTPPLFKPHRADDACPGEPARPSELTLYVFFARNFFAIFYSPPGLCLHVLIPRVTNKLSIFKHNF